MNIKQHGSCLYSQSQKGHLNEFHLPTRRKFPKTQPCTLAPEHSSLSELVASSSLGSDRSSHLTLNSLSLLSDRAAVCPGADVCGGANEGGDAELPPERHGTVHCIPPCSPFSFSTAAQTLLLIYWVVTPPDAAHINRGHKEQCDYMLTEHSKGQ